METDWCSGLLWLHTHNSAMWEGIVGWKSVPFIEIMYGNRRETVSIVRLFRSHKALILLSTYILTQVTASVPTIATTRFVTWRMNTTSLWDVSLSSENKIRTRTEENAQIYLYCSQWRRDTSRWSCSLGRRGRLWSQGSRLRMRREHENIEIKKQMQMKLKSNFLRCLYQEKKAHRILIF